MNQLPNFSPVKEAPVSSTTLANLESPRVLFFAMDAISDREKLELDFKQFGGIHLPHVPGLRDQKYMLYRCQLTKLPPFKYVASWDTMLPPEQRTQGGRWSRSFTQVGVGPDGREVETTVNGFLESSPEAVKEGRFEQKRSHHLMFTKRFAEHDAAKAVRRRVPHGEGGVVEIKALLNASDAEIANAQRFFFPNWDEIAQGDATLPTTTGEMEAHLKERIEEAKSLPGDLRNKYISIGTDMLRSVTEYVRAAKNTIKTDQIMVDAAFKAGETLATNSEASEMMLAQTGIRRKNDLLTSEASATSELVQEMRAERATKEVEAARSRELEERRIFLEEVKLGIRNPDGSLVGQEAPTKVEAQPEVTVEPETGERQFAIGDIVSVDGREGEIISKPFGKLKVLFEDGTEETVTKDRIV